MPKLIPHDTLARMTIAVTGASGFIGTALCQRLRNDGHDVIAIDVTGNPDRHADVADPSSTIAALAGADAIVHAAAIVAERGHMDDFIRVNVRGTRNVLDAAGPRRTVVLASVAGWGYEFARELREDSPPRPCGLPYVDTKGATETLALRRGATVIRPGDVYGPGSTPWVIRPLEMMRAGRFFLPSPGDGVMTPVFIDDLVDAIVRAARRATRGRPRLHGVGRLAGLRARVLRDARRPAGADAAGAAAPGGRASVRNGPGGRDLRHAPGGVPERTRPRGAGLAAADDVRRGHGAHARMGAHDRPA